MGTCGRVPAPSPWPATWPREAGGRGHRHAEPAQDPLCSTRERRAAGPGGTLVRMMALVAGARCPGLALCIAASDPGEATWALSALGTSRRPNSGEHPPTRPASAEVIFRSVGDACDRCTCLCLGRERGHAGGGRGQGWPHSPGGRRPGRAPARCCPRTLCAPLGRVTSHRHHPAYFRPLVYFGKWILGSAIRNVTRTSGERDFAKPITENSNQIH